METEVKVEDIEQVMYKEAQDEFKEAGNMTLGTKDHVETVKTATMITNQLNEMNKIKNESKRLEIEDKKIKNEKFKTIVDGAVKVGTAVLAAGVFMVTYSMDRKDERDGIMITSEGGRQAKRGLFSALGGFLK